LPVKNAKRILALKHRKARDQEHKFLIEGIRLCEESLRSRVNVEQLVFCRDTLRENERLRALRADAGKRSVTVQETDRRAMRGMCETQTPQGVLGVVRMPQWSRDEALSSGSVLLILDRVRDPGNLGLILRTAEAASAGGIFISGGSVELYNPKVVRSSMGAIFRVPVFSGEDLPQLLEELKAHRISTCAAHRDGRPFTHISQEGPIALLLGNEAFGIEPSLVPLVDQTVSIPMAPAVDSLNVAIAAGVLLFGFTLQPNP